MTDIYLGLGSNLGKREQHLFEAIHALTERVGKLESVSSIYETEAKYVSDQPDYLNMAVRGETTLSAMNLFIACKDIEKQMGRDFTERRYGPRVIDIDILFYGTEIITTEDLIVPHPRIAERRFVLVPLNELNPGWVHPKLNKTVRTLLENCHDNGKIREFNSSNYGISD